MTSIRVEPATVQSLASGFSDLVASMGAAGANLQFDLGDTGDGRIADALEQFAQDAKAAIGQLTTQFSQLQQVLQASAQGYDQLDTKLASAIESDLAGA